MYLLDGAFALRVGVRSLYLVVLQYSCVLKNTNNENILSQKSKTGKLLKIYNFLKYHILIHENVVSELRTANLTQILFPSKRGKSLTNLTRWRTYELELETHIW